MGCSSSVVRGTSDTTVAGIDDASAEVTEIAIGRTRATHEMSAGSALAVGSEGKKSNAGRQPDITLEFKEEREQDPTEEAESRLGYMTANKHREGKASKPRSELKDERAPHPQTPPRASKAKEPKLIERAGGEDVDGAKASCSRVTASTNLASKAAVEGKHPRSFDPSVEAQFKKEPAVDASHSLRSEPSCPTESKAGYKREPSQYKEEKRSNLPGSASGAKEQKDVQ